MSEGGNKGLLSACAVLDIHKLENLEENFLELDDLEKFTEVQKN